MKTKIYSSNWKDIYYIKQRYLILEASKVEEIVKQFNTKTYTIEFYDKKTKTKNKRNITKNKINNVIKELIEKKQSFTIYEKMMQI